jgi:hypothetical protein
MKIEKDSDKASAIDAEFKRRLLADSKERRKTIPFSD